LGNKIDVLGGSMEYQQMIYDCAESFYESTRIPLSILDREGIPLFNFGGACNFCAQFKKLGGEEQCIRRHMLSCRLAVELKKGYVFSCPGGCILFTVGLTQKNEHVCSIIAGPVLPETPNIKLVDDILRKLELPLTGRNALYTALMEVELMEPRKIEYMCRLLDYSTRYLLDAASSHIQISKEKTEEAGRIQAYLSAIQAEPELKTDDIRLRGLEDKLVNAIRAGNSLDAKNFMEQLFSERSIYSGMQTKVTTIHAIELLTLLSRTAIDAGAGVYAMYKFTDQAFNQLMEARSINQISYLLARSVENAVSKLDVVETDETTALIRQSIYYIHQNYTENMTLETVAGHVHLSPSYFSSLFNKQTGLSFTSYVSRLRVERAKKLLKKTEMSLIDIATALGFGSQSYFSSVFKKHVGESPKQYRQRGGKDGHIPG
jgi:AraC-like DNA-binding protein/ligand-binding sensor protein